VNGRCARLHKVCCPFDIPSSERMPDRIICQSILREPFTCPKVQFWNEIRLFCPEMMAQHPGKQLVVAIPLPFLVQALEKEVGALTILEYGLATGLPGHSLA
jgi:hypothetical protein